MGLRETTHLFKSALGLTACGVIFHLIGLATRNWYAATIIKTYTNQKTGEEETEKKYANAGLFKYCKPNGDCDEYKEDRDWMDASKALAILVLVAGLLVIVTLLLYVFVEKYRTTKYYMIAGIGNLVAAGLSNVVVILVAMNACEDIDLAKRIHRGAVVKDKGMSWSFALFIIGMILHSAAGIVMFINKYIFPQTEESQE